MYFIYSHSSQFHFRITRGLAIGEFRIPGAVTSAFFLRESEANAGHFSPRRQTNIKKTVVEMPKKGKFKTLKGFGGLKTYL